MTHLSFGLRGRVAPVAGSDLVVGAARAVARRLGPTRSVAQGDRLAG